MRRLLNVISVNFKLLVNPAQSIAEWHLQKTHKFVRIHSCGNLTMSEVQNI